MLFLRRCRHRNFLYFWSLDLLGLLNLESGHLLSLAQLPFIKVSLLGLLACVILPLQDKFAAAAMMMMILGIAVIGLLLVEMLILPIYLIMAFAANLTPLLVLPLVMIVDFMMFCVLLTDFPVSVVVRLHVICVSIPYSVILSVFVTSIHCADAQIVVACAVAALWNV